MESVYNLIKPDAPAARVPKAFKAVSADPTLRAAPPTASTFGQQGTSRLLGNVAGERKDPDSDAHPSKKPVGSMGKVVGHGVYPGEFIKKSLKPGGAAAGGLTGATAAIYGQQENVKATRGAGGPGIRAAAAVRSVNLEAGAAAAAASMSESRTRGEIYRGVGMGTQGGVATGEGSAMRGEGVPDGADHAATSGDAMGSNGSPASQYQGASPSGEHPAVAGTAGGSHRYKQPVRAAVPLREEAPVMGLKSEMNFVLTNAQEAGQRALNLPKEQPKLTIKGLERRDYGEMPKYLSRMNTERREMDAQIRAAAEAAARPDYDELTTEEIHELRDGLNRRMQACMKQFQTMKFASETRGQRARKDQLEAQMRAVEVALNKLSKPRVLVVDS